MSAPPRTTAHREEPSEPELAGLPEIEAAAHLLVAAGRRSDAIALVEETNDRDALLLLARLHLGSETREGAKAAVEAIQLWRVRNPNDVEALSLLRRALDELDLRRSARELDREIRWLTTPRGRRRTSHRRGPAS